VSAATDTGVAVGVRGYAKDVHTGNYNIGLYGDAENGDTGLTYGGNVSLFLANGNIVTSSAAAKSWYLGGNITFDGQGSAKTISATNGAVISVSSGITGTLPIANGGTGQTTANAAFNALVPSQTSNSGKFLTTDGTNTSWATTATAVTLSNDTSTSTNLYPLFAAATSGTASTIYTGNAKLLYKPSTGDLQSTAMVSANGITINASSVTASYTIATGTNGFSVGPLTIASGVTVTIASGQRHIII
jgi:hypothetical protein